MTGSISFLIINWPPSLDYHHHLLRLFEHLTRMTCTKSDGDERRFFMGLDASTQSLKASLLDEQLRVVGELGVNFDADVAQHKTQSGVLHGPDGQVFSPVELLTDALELLLVRLRQADWPLRQVKAISASGQQHATVYWSQQSSHLLSTLPQQGSSLSAHLRPAFSRSIMPNWQDSSTASECQQLEEAVGGPAALARLTGSSAHTRFSAAQIMRFRQQEPQAWSNTARISLCSSALTTLLCLDGEVKAIDESDAGGMNLWDLTSKPHQWNSTLLNTVAGSTAEAERLERMLGKVETDAGCVVGKLGEWFNLHFGMHDCLVTTGTGDNPATFLSFVLPQRHAVLSLGTSDTLLLSSTAYVPDEAHHVFVHPAQRGAAKGEETRYMSMLCFKNGSLAREAARNAFADSSWDTFNTAITQAKGLPTRARFSWLLPEIIPKNAHGTARYARTGEDETWELQEQPFDAATDALALLEAQFMSYRIRLARILSSSSSSKVSDAGRLEAIYAVGGAAQNPAICKVAADILAADVLRPAPSSTAASAEHASLRWTQEVAHSNACSVGAAYKAFWAHHRHTATDEHAASISFDDCIRTARSSQHSTAYVAIEPDGARNSVYEEAATSGWWSELEERAVSEAT